LYSGHVIEGSPSVLIEEVNSATCNSVIGYFPDYYAEILNVARYEPDGTANIYSTIFYEGYLGCGGSWRDIVTPPYSAQSGGPQHFFRCENDFGARYELGEAKAEVAYEGYVRAYCRCPALNLKWNGRACVIRNIAENKPPTLIGYFNGVANTRPSANISLNRLVREFPSTQAKILVHELFYNQTTCESGAFRQGKIPCLEDIAEVFDQRISELNGVLKNRWEYFWEILSGRSNQDGSLTATLTSRFGVFANSILQLIDSIYAVIINQLAGSFPRLITILNSKPTAAETAGHVAKLKTYADKGSGMVLIAHSQGNLFVNAAYDGIKASTPAAKVKVVHVAPASPTLRGEYVLADVDFVIRALRKVVGSGVAAVNINMPLSANDETGHAFEGTYLDITRNAYARLKAMITSALSGV
jgi:hypothetical protein